MQKAAFGANFVSDIFEISNVGLFAVSITGLTAGIVTFEYSKNGGTNWYAFDPTNLTFSADGVKTVCFGGVLIRSKGDGSIAGANLDVSIEGFYVSPPHVATPH